MTFCRVAGYAVTRVFLQQSFVWSRVQLTWMRQRLVAQEGWAVFLPIAQALSSAKRGLFAGAIDAW